MPTTISKHRFVAKLGVLAAVAVMGGNAMAQTPPGAIPVGPMFAYPEIEVAVKRDSNIALLPDATRQADTIWYLRPALKLEAKQGENVYDVTYRGEFGRYNDNTAQNFNNHDLNGRANMTLDARNNLKLGLQYENKVDPPGSLVGVATTPVPNNYIKSTGTGLYTYGAQDAQGKLELQGGYFDKVYQNNRTATIPLDMTQADYGGTFLWRVMPKTYLTATLKQSKMDYKQSTSTLDGTNTYQLIGVRWEATAATSGKFSIGNLNKKFDSAGKAAGRQDQSLPSWEGSVEWKPLSYSTVDFQTQQVANESTGLGDFSKNSTNRALWTHAWTSRITTKLGGSYSVDEFQNAPVASAGNANRRDKTKEGGLRVDYTVQRWLKFGAEYRYTGRDSNDNTADYNRGQFMLLLSGTL